MFWNSVLFLASDAAGVDWSSDGAGFQARALAPVIQVLCTTDSFQEEWKRQDLWFGHKGWEDVLSRTNEDV